MTDIGSHRLAGVIELLLESSSRINEAKPQPYWYPLAVATYGVDEIVEAIDSMCRFRTSMWEKTAEFETRFASYLGASHAVMVNSGSSADLLLCHILTNPRRRLLAAGDEVLIPAVTWPTQVWSALMAGLAVRLVDVDPETLNVDLDDLEHCIGERTRAVFPVHLLGNPCDMDRLMAIARRHDLLVLEDTCEALGADWAGQKVGTFGLGGAFSFFFSHHIMTMEGGMVCCHDDDLAEDLRMMRAHGWLRGGSAKRKTEWSIDIDPRYTFVNWGFNLRPTEIQAGFGLHQLAKLPAFSERRRALAGRVFDYIDAAPFLTRPLVAPPARACWMALPIVVDAAAPFSRDDLARHLEGAGVETRPIVAGNLARQPAARLMPENRLRAGHLPGADAVHQQGMYLGLSPMIGDEIIDRLCETLDGFLNTYR